jgi:hypothetical protein
VAARAAADQIAADLKMALSITEQTPTAVTFTVPDRSGDGVTETIRYAWAGPGSPVTRQCNGQPVPAASIADNVQSFSLQYAGKTTGPATPVESAEQLLISYDNAASTQDFGVKKSTWIAQYFKPTLPANAIAWKITRIKVQAKKAVGIITTHEIDVHAVDGNKKPTGSPLDTATFASAGLTTVPTWIEIPYSNLAGLDPARGYAVVFKQLSLLVISYYVRYNNAAGSSTDKLSCSTTNAGGSWTGPTSNNTTQFYVYGTITTQGP